VAVPSDFGMPYTEEDLKTKDGINLKSYIIIQQDQQEAKRVPTILYFHVKIIMLYYHANFFFLIFFLFTF
jgi:hypothetical protein